jgi:Tfp pilus assembly protein PilF
MKKLLNLAMPVVLSAALLAGCAATTMRERGWDQQVQSGAGRLLIDGLQQYEDGDLKKASQSLNGALSAGLNFQKDQVTAHKYLAFINCASAHEQICREQFAAALALDPGLELTPAEAGHPLWGPVFKSVKSRFARPLAQ